METKRIQQMIDSFNKDGRAFSNLSNNDNAFFKGINMRYDELGITSQTGNDLVYYSTEIYASDTNALRMKKNL